MILQLIKFKNFLIGMFFLSICLGSCVKKNNLSEEGKIRAFFEELLFEHGGAYTLFGSKAVTIENLLNDSEEDRRQIEAYFKQHPEIECLQVDRYLEEGWDLWKDKTHQVSESFVLRQMQFSECQLLVFLNVPVTVALLEDYKSDFENVLGKDFKSLELIEELRLGLDDRWKLLLTNPVTEGILLGYGLKNARHFAEGIDSSFSVSENNDPRLPAACYINGRPFRLPIFVLFDDEESQTLVEKYKQERQRIQEYYKDKDFLSVTLAKLMSRS